MGTGEAAIGFTRRPGKAGFNYFTQIGGRNQLVLAAEGRPARAHRPGNATSKLGGRCQKATTSVLGLGRASPMIPARCFASSFRDIDF